MSSEWQAVELGDLIDVAHGYAFKSKFFRDEPTSYSLFTRKNFAIGGGFRTDGRRYYDPEGPIPEKFILSPGDMLVVLTDLSKSGDLLGFPARVPRDDFTYLHNQRVGKVILKDDIEVDGHFVYYVLCSPLYREHVLATATQTTVRDTAPSRIKAYRLLLPPPDEQRRIAGILGAIDAKLSHGEYLTQQLWRACRLYFRAIRAKTCDEAVEMELGDIVELAYGKALKESDRVPGPVRVYGSSGLVGWHNRSLVDGPGVVVGRKGSAGTVTWAPASFFPIDTTFYARPTGDIDSLIFLHQLLADLGLESLNSDSAVPGLNRELAYQVPVSVPPPDAVDNFDAFARPLLEAIAGLEEEGHALRHARNNLIPRLVSGSLRVPETYDPDSSLREMAADLDDQLAA